MDLPALSGRAGSAHAFASLTIEQLNYEGYMTMNMKKE
jgi:hypothetical protein